MSWTGLSALSLLAVLLAPPPANAWGSEGHAIVADTAEAHHTPPALRRVTEILYGSECATSSVHAGQKLSAVIRSRYRFWGASNLHEV